jgi:hypothetical protein
VITLDTSAVLALLNRRDPAHEAVVAELKSDDGPYLIPAGILGEIGYLAERRLRPEALDKLLGDLEERAFELDCGDERLGRVRELVSRYADLPLGLADATVVACAEKNQGRVLTLDVRHFTVVGREVGLTVLP